MSYIKRINRTLQKCFDGRVTASEADGCLVLNGSLTHWDDVVRAGQCAVNKRRYVGLVNRIVCTGEPCPAMRVPPVTDRALDGQSPDVLIIGGGIVGCAIARELSRYRLDVLVVEKEHDVALHASSRNDGMVHPGIDLLPGQKKRAYNRRGNRMYDAVCRELDVPFRRCGQYLCLPSRLYSVLGFLSLAYFALFGPRARFVGAKALFRQEPYLDKGIKSALFFPDAGVVSPYCLTIAYMENAIDNGARLSLDTAVLDMCVEHERILSVQTNRGTLHPRVVVNAAGVFSDEIARFADDQFFSIHPRRGTNTILDTKAAVRLNTIASSFGTSSTKKRHTKGGGLVRTIDGNVLVGPDAHETPLREDFTTDGNSLRDTFEKQRRTDPALSLGEAITYFTGVRAATYEEDFVIRKGRRTHNLVHAAGIQSPGLTAAPAIAVDVAKMAVSLLAEEKRVETNPTFDPCRKGIPRVNSLSDAQRAALIQQDPDFGEIVCRCEKISRGEIKAALHRSVPCDTLDGVKRRVRPGMGRCQGGFCGALVLQIIADETGMPLTAVRKSGYGSELLLGELKEGVLHADGTI